MGHQYGPPTPPDPWPTVTIFRAEERGGDYQTPMPVALVHQRRRIDEMAYEKACQEVIEDL